MSRKPETTVAAPDPPAPRRRAFLRSALSVAACGPALPTLQLAVLGACRRREAPGSTTAATPTITGDVAADEVLAAAARAVLPRGGPGPSGDEANVAGHLALVAASPEFVSLRGLWLHGAGALDSLARSAASNRFAALSEERAADLLRACAEGAHGATLRALAGSVAEFAVEGYFAHPRHGGNRNAAVWRSYRLAQMLTTAGPNPLAHSHTPSGAPTTPVASTDPDRAARRTWDVLVVGSGAGGGALAYRLASRSLDVLVLEKGPRLPPGVALHDEVSVIRRNLLVPYTKDEPHVVARQGGAEETREGWTACCVGGGTVHMSAMLLRMHPRDFVGDPTDGGWPISYDTLRPYYDQVEAHVGVAGADSENPFEPPRPSYPLPPLATHPVASRAAATARRAGLHPYSAPRGILTRPHRGRGPCVYCPFCSNYACEADAKASAEAAFLREAERTGRAAVLAGWRALAIRATRGGGAEGIDAIDPAGQRRVLRAKTVVLAAGAVESARLALLSIAPSFPRGPGGRRGQVGRGLVFSYNAGLAGLFPYPGDLFTERDDAAPFVNVAIQDHYDGESGLAGAPRLGTIVVERRPPSPIHHALRIMGSGAQGWLGVPLKERLHAEMAGARSLIVESFIPMRPHGDRVLSLDGQVVDALGLPAARLTLARFPSDATAGARVLELGGRLLRDLGAARTAHEIPLEETMFLPAGTLRMGLSPETSVVGPGGRFHDVPNLYACDGSVLPNLGGVPPTLTIMANALRIADGIATQRG